MIAGIFVKTIMMIGDVCWVISSAGHSDSQTSPGMVLFYSERIPDQSRIGRGREALVNEWTRDVRFYIICSYVGHESFFNEIAFAHFGQPRFHMPTSKAMMHPMQPTDLAATWVSLWTRVTWHLLRGQPKLNQSRYT